LRKGRRNLRSLSLKNRRNRDRSYPNFFFVGSYIEGVGGEYEFRCKRGLILWLENISMGKVKVK
jgi:hypothetical protein